MSLLDQILLSGVVESSSLERAGGDLETDSEKEALSSEPGKNCKSISDQSEKGDRPRLGERTAHLTSSAGILADADFSADSGVLTESLELGRSVGVNSVKSREEAGRVAVGAMCIPRSAHMVGLKSSLEDSRESKELFRV